MEKLQDMTERLAAAILVVDGEDLPGLARIHNDLTELPAAISGDETLSEAARGGASKAVNAAAQLVEKILLRDIKDTSAALVSVSEQIVQLQAILTGTVVAGAPVKGTEEKAEAEAKVEEGADDKPLRADDLPLIAEFIAEANSHLETAEGNLLELGSDPHNKELIAAVFRSFHTIKGVAGFLNLQQIGKLTHAAENLLDLARQEKLTLEGVRLDITLEALDATKLMIANLDAAAKTGGVPAGHPGMGEILKRLHQAASGGELAPSQPVAPIAAPSIPVENPPIPVENPPIPAASHPKTASQAPAHPKGQTGDASHPTASTGGPAAPGARTEATVKVTTEKLDALINMVGELVIAESMVTQAIAPSFRSNQRLARNAGHLGKITRELQDLTMSMRMVPIQGVFQKMSRLVRDLSAKFGKQIDLVLTGGETELDRNLVEALADPLVHMVRNSADHGLEPTEDRIKAGKPAVGRIELKAYHQAGNIVVDITDDGRGLNKARILDKAKKAGIVKEDSQLSEQEIFKLIFHAGLSTAEKVTDVSGRGVGMDVVRRNVESLRGRIDIQSVEGKGSTFSIRLPLTLAVIDGLIAKVGNEKYIIPITSVIQSLRPKPEVLSTVHNRAEICTIRGEVLPLYRLHRLFKVESCKEDPCEALIVIVQDNERRCCLLVDELLGQQQVVIKTLDNSTGSVPGVSGGAILGDGTISLILDVPGLMDLVAKERDGAGAGQVLQHV
ncbi:MAG TPA: chemotaxis protein CheA [Phycisphaerae bacterium]|nr:chemotaxis protein CheA [Phycisphaerae bacterium]